MIREFKGIAPKIADDVFTAENASIIGNVEIGRDSSVWFGAVIRGDQAEIRIGTGCSVQDNCVLHCDRTMPMRIGNNVTIGHGAVVHSAVLGDNVLVGMGATVLSGAVIGENSIIGAGALVKEKDHIPAGVLAVGVPAKVVRKLSDEEIAAMKQTSPYVALSKEYM